jgi:hypothetical protein
MKTIWLIRDESDFNNIRVLEFTALDIQLKQFSEVGFFDNPLPSKVQKKLLGAENMVVEQYGEPYESGVIETLDCIKFIAEYKNSADAFTLNGLKYFQGAVDFIKKYDPDKYFLLIG